MPRMMDICKACGFRWGKHYSFTCPGTAGTSWSYGEPEKEEETSERMHKPLDWDPKKKTPFDPFKDWGEKGIDWEIWKGRSFDEKRKPNYSEATGVHPLQKGVPKG